MANGDASGHVTWQKVAVGLASLLASGFMLLEKDTIDHMGRLDLAMTNQASALNKMAGSLDQLTISNDRFDTSLEKIYDRLHELEEAQASALASVVTNEHDITLLRDEFNRHIAKDDMGFKTRGVTPP